MSDNKIIQPTFPMSEEEHDKYVDLAWNNGKTSLQELKFREFIDKDILQYFTGVLVASSSDIYIQNVGAHFKFSDRVEANVKCKFNFPLGAFFNFVVQGFLDGKELAEVKIDNLIPKEIVLKSLNNELRVISGLTDLHPEKYDEFGGKSTDGKCRYCWEDDVNFPLNLLTGGLSLSSDYDADVTTITVASIDVYISEEGNMELLITNSADEPISKKILPIKYCPMCGRKLGGNYDF